MPVSVTMPRLGESVTEGTVTRWLKQEGDRVEADEPLLEVSTDKVDTEIPSPAAGVLQRIVVQEDETAEVGSELAVIAGDGEAEAAEPTAQAAPAEQAPAESSAVDTSAVGSAAPGSAAPGSAAPGSAAPGSAAPGAAGGAAAAAGSDAAGSAAAGSAAADGSAGAATTDRRKTPATDATPTTDALSSTTQSSMPAPTSSAPGSSGSAAGDATVVKMPALGESVTEGTVTRWLKQVGETVEADEPLLEVSTDKVDTEIPSPAAGTLLEIKVPEDETAPVGAELAVIGAAGGAPAQPAPSAQPAPQPAPSAQTTAPQAAQAAPAPQPAQPTPQADSRSARSAPADSSARPDRAEQKPPAGPTQTGQPTAAPAAQPGTPVQDTGAYVTPLVRKLAADHGVDLGQVTGTGVGGRIRRQDVLDAAARQRAAATSPAGAAATAPAAKAQPQEPSPLRGTTEKMSRMRALIARRMVESLQTAAQLTTVVEVDVTRIARLREQAKADFLARHGVKLSFLPFFTLAAVEALRVHPKLNATIDTEAGTITYFDAEHLGVAVDTERGLMVPVIHNAGDLNLSGLAKRIADLAERTRTAKLSPDDVSGGTFTLTNTGSRGALFDTPIINQPQVAILGTGAVVKRAVVVDDPDLGELILPRSMVYLALTYDHRLVDGADAARYLTAVKERLEGGNFEADLGL